MSMTECTHCGTAIKRRELEGDWASPDSLIHTVCPRNIGGHAPAGLESPEALGTIADIVGHDDDQDWWEVTFTVDGTESSTQVIADDDHGARYYAVAAFGDRIKIIKVEKV